MSFDPSALPGLHTETQALHAGQSPDPTTKARAVPIYAADTRNPGLAFRRASVHTRPARPPARLTDCLLHLADVPSRPRQAALEIRRRLILAHVFIGAIPVLLIIFITYVSLLLFYYQLTYYLISNQIGIHTAQAHAFNYSLRSTIQQALSDYPDRPSEWRNALDRDSKYLLGAYPSASVILHVQVPMGEKGVTVGFGSVNQERLDHYQVPRWLGDREFSKLVVEDTQPAIYRSTAADAGGAGKGKLFIRSVLFSDSRPELPFSIEVSVPFERHLLGQLKAAIGQNLLLANEQLRTPSTSSHGATRTEDI